MEMTKIISPAFMDGLFKHRPYVKQVRYIGENEGYFVKGEVYETKTFNGATYTFEGRSGFIGMVYFEEV